MQDSGLISLCMDVVDALEVLKASPWNRDSTGVLSCWDACRMLWELCRV